MKNIILYTRTLSVPAILITQLKNTYYGEFQSEHRIETFHSKERDI